ncbi:MAG: hypothetical protein GWP08_19340 [Nitrospiraceae bacterium]|nr:hypothetical protein [Nitrospiraceae bacterium]
MVLCIGICFYPGVALYVAAAIAALWYLRHANEFALRLALWLSAGGVGLLIMAFAARWAAWGLVPLTTVSDSLNLLVVMSTLAMLLLMRTRNVRALAWFYLTPLAALTLVSAAVAHKDLFHSPKELSGIPLTLHVGLVFLAYAMFFMAAMTSAAYILQNHRLKRPNALALSHHLPSLEQLDHTLTRLVSLGYPLFLATLVLGLIWAHAEGGLLSSRWWMAPKVLLSFVMAALYAVAFHRRRSGRLRGPKLAYLLCLGFALLLAAYLVLALMQLREYSFWENAV